MPGPGTRDAFMALGNCYNADGRDSALGGSGDDDKKNTYHSFAISTR